MRSVEIQICSRRYNLRCEDPQEMQAIADDINALLDEIKQQTDCIDFHKLLLLLALQQQEQIRALKKANAELKNDIDRMNQMVSKIIGDV
ncbi:MAG: cell division protein ZapA [Candidatus Cloacimonetes bacterium]|nr:cell division protein ZapA [Candidatus Cloacimonadota bacterium]